MIKPNEVLAQGTDPWLPPCFIEGLPEAEYFAIEAASSTFLKTMVSKSPLHAKEAPHIETASMSLGTLAHKMILEPDNVERDVIVKPAGCSLKSNAEKSNLVNWMADVLGVEPSPVPIKLPDGKRFDLMIEELTPKLDEVGKLICTQAQFDTASRMRDNVMAKEIGAVIFAGGKAEVTVLAVHPFTGVLVKGKIDWLPEGHEVIVDLKTAESCCFDDFAKACGRYSYHMQASLYQALESFFGATPRKDFLHCVVENTPPYDCAFYQLDQEALDAGKAAWERGLDLYRMCEKLEKWPGVGWDWGLGEYGIDNLSLPKWALK